LKGPTLKENMDVMTHTKDCPFCFIAQEKEHDRIILQNANAFLVRDGYPLSLGHSLIIPKSHTTSYFDLSSSEKEDMNSLLEQAKVQIDEEFQPESFNIGINDGPAAGQTIPHCHMHLIPRYESSADPRGGVRWVLPETADYWSEQQYECDRN
jgi:diadenosine tetraphosphate (Ap4A) HIT family hydrolase